MSMLCNRWNHWFHLFPLLRIRHRPFHGAQRIKHTIEPLAHGMQRLPNLFAALDSLGALGYGQSG